MTKNRRLEGWITKTIQQIYIHINKDAETFRRCVEVLEKRLSLLEERIHDHDKETTWLRIAVQEVRDNQSGGEHPPLADLIKETPSPWEEEPFRATRTVRLVTQDPAPFSPHPKNRGIYKCSICGCAGHTAKKLNRPCKTSGGLFDE